MKILKIKYLNFNHNAIVLCVCFVVFFACSTDETQKVTNFETIVLQDEFDANGQPDSSIWGYDLGTGEQNGLIGWGNNELQYYTDRPENVTVENGVLKITARQEQFNGSGYTSARLVTKNKFEKAYGRFEARIKLPWGQGIWPAFWMLGANCDEISWPQCGEIDIMEFRGQAPTITIGTLHGPGYSGGESISRSYELKNDRFDTDFHVFGIEWGPNYINHYVDNVLFSQLTPDDVPGEWVYDHEFYIILNLAVGGNFVGPPNQNTVFPQTMEIDYVRVYEFE